MSEGKIRSFIAVDIESLEVIDQISVFQRMLRNTGADLKPVKTENIHITLRFLGEIPPSLSERIGEKLKTLSFAPFNVLLKGVGVFPNFRRISVIWVGIESGILEFVAIHNQLKSLLKGLSTRPDDRGFNPHVTIARMRSAKNKEKLTEVVLANQDMELGGFCVSSVKLKRSVLTPKGPIYTTLSEVHARV